MNLIISKIKKIYPVSVYFYFPNKRSLYLKVKYFMISSAFSCFDPFIYIWKFFWLFLFFIYYFFTYSSNFFNFFFLFDFFLDFLYRVLSDFNISNICGIIFLIINVFFVIFFCNFIGILPLVFSFSSHILWRFFLGFPLWLSFQISRFYFNPFLSIRTFILSGCSYSLIFLLSLVEIMSLFIQPITLSVRLIANLSAGHLFLSLLSISLCFFLINFNFNIFFLIFIFIFYYIFELAVNLVQSYIFFLLIRSYGGFNVNLINLKKL